jgi:hypothetical protein
MTMHLVWLQTILSLRWDVWRQKSRQEATGCVPTASKGDNLVCTPSFSCFLLVKKDRSNQHVFFAYFLTQPLWAVFLINIRLKVRVQHFFINQFNLTLQNPVC